MTSSVQHFIPLLTALVGGAVGAFLQYFFTERSKANQRREELKAQAYVDFLKATSDVAMAQKIADSKAVHDASCALADSKARICIYGDERTLKKLSEFFNDHGHACTPQARQALASAISQIRKDSNSVDKGLEDAIRILLFGPDKC